jgi:hypothetical protein
MKALHGGSRGSLGTQIGSRHPVRGWYGIVEVIIQIPLAGTSAGRRDILRIFLKIS